LVLVSVVDTIIVDRLLHPGMLARQNNKRGFIKINQQKEIK